MKKLGLPSLEYRRQRQDLIQVYKIMNGLDKLNKDTLFKAPPEGSQRLRGNRYKIHKTRSNTELRKSIFSQRVVEAWNKLPDRVVDAPSLNSFKSNLNKYWTGASDIKFAPSCLE